MSGKPLSTRGCRITAIQRHHLASSKVELVVEMPNGEELTFVVPRDHHYQLGEWVMLCLASDEEKNR